MNRNEFKTFVKECLEEIIKTHLPKKGDVIVTTMPLLKKSITRLNSIPKGSRGKIVDIKSVNGNFLYRVQFLSIGVVSLTKDEFDT